MGLPWDIRYQWYLDWKVGLHAKGFFKLGHANILQVFIWDLYQDCNVVNAGRNYFTLQVMGTVATFFIFLFQLNMSETATPGSPA